MNPQDYNKFELDNLKKENPYQVPEGYFDSLGEKISDRIQANAPKEKKLGFEFVRVKPLLLFAGGFISLSIIISIGVSIFSGRPDIVKNPAEVEIASINDYVYDLDESTFMETVTEQSPAATDSLHQENKDNIINYLVKENIDISTIIDEL